MNDSAMEQLEAAILSKASVEVITEHRLTWRMWHPVTVFAVSREMAIAQAIHDRPKHIPAGTELHYGPVGGKPVYVAI